VKHYLWVARNDFRFRNKVRTAPKRIVWRQSLRVWNFCSKCSPAAVVLLLKFDRLRIIIIIIIIIVFIKILRYIRLSLQSKGNWSR
jgi:hypothetical protein